MRKLLRMAVLVLSLAAVAEFLVPEKATAYWFGVCAFTCEQCWHPDDCPPMNGMTQPCVSYCY